MKAHPEHEAEPRDWIRIHKPTGHRSSCTRSMALHRLYIAQPELPPQTAINLIETGVPFETDFARYEKGE